jgi:hypothetical protein
VLTSPMEFLVWTVEIRLCKRPEIDTVAFERVQMLEGLQRTFAAQSVKHPEQQQIKPALGRVSEHLLEFCPLTFEPLS